MHQAFTRACTKLNFALGLGHMIANTTGVVRFDHIQEKLGQMWNMAELARSAIVAAEAGATVDEGGVLCPDERPFIALRGEMPKWLPRCNEYLQLIGGGGFMATPSRPTSTGRCASRSTCTSRPAAPTPSAASGCSGWPGTSWAPSWAAAASCTSASTCRTRGG